MLNVGIFVDILQDKLYEGSDNPFYLFIRHKQNVIIAIIVQIKLTSITR